MTRGTLLAVLTAAAAACGTDDGALPSDAPPAPTGPILPAGGDTALEFDGVDDYATTGTAGFPIMRGPQTVSLWARHPTVEATQIMIVLRADLESGLAIGIANGTVGAWNIFGPRTLASSVDPPSLDRWHHLAYVFDGTKHTFYLDAVVAGTGTREPGVRTPGLCWLGTFDGTSQFYRGHLDEIRIWNTARTAEEIALEAQGNAPPTEALVAYWKFDTIEGARMADESGRGNLVSLGEGDPQRMPNLVPSSRLKED